FSLELLEAFWNTQPFILHRIHQIETDGLLIDQGLKERRKVRDVFAKGIVKASFALARRCFDSESFLTEIRDFSAGLKRFGTLQIVRRREQRNEFVFSRLGELNRQVDGIGGTPLEPDFSLCVSVELDALDLVRPACVLVTVGETG